MRFPQWQLWRVLTFEMSHWVVRCLPLFWRILPKFSWLKTSQASSKPYPEIDTNTGWGRNLRDQWEVKAGPENYRTERVSGIKTEVEEAGKNGLRQSKKGTGRRNGKWRADIMGWRYSMEAKEIFFPLASFYPVIFLFPFCLSSLWN